LHKLIQNYQFRATKLFISNQTYSKVRIADLDYTLRKEIELCKDFVIDIMAEMAISKNKIFRGQKTLKEYIE